MKLKKTPIIIVAIIILVVAIGLYSYSSYTPDSSVQSAIIADSPATETDTTETTSESSSLNEELETEEQESITSSTGTLEFFEFEGYSVGKSHTGTFETINANIYSNNGVITSADISILTESVNTGIGGLDDHLREADMLSANLYPEIMFKTSDINYDSNTAVGDLTFLGVTKEVSIPLTIGSEGLVSTDFLLDISEFGMEYVGVNSDIRIAFSVSP